MSLIWFCLMLSSMLVMLATKPDAILATMLSVSNSTLSFCLEMCAIYAIWLGILEIMEKSRLSEKIAKLLSPLTSFLFKTKNKKTQQHLAINLSSNLLGVGSAATPAGIEAMKELEKEQGKSSFGMIMLVVISSTSIQLLPTTIIAIRQSMGSLSPFNIILPSLISTAISTFLGVILVFLINKLKKERKK